MCGLVAAFGAGSADIGAAALNVLTYRGYDSFGWYAKGKFGEVGVRSLGEFEGIDGEVRGIVNGAHVFLGHTRWATRGVVAVENSHPVASSSGRFLAIHNGALIGVDEAANRLRRLGIEFATETDTEVLVNLFEHKASYVPRAAAAAWIFAGADLGSDVSCVIFDRQLDEAFAICGTGSLLVGDFSDGTIVSSDANSFASSVQYRPLDQGEVVPIRLRQFTYPDHGRVELPSAIHPRRREKGSRMISEIEETPDVLGRAIANGRRLADAISAQDEWVLTGMGSSYYSAEFGARLLSRAGYRATAVQADELHVSEGADGGGLIAISQSGETFETVATSVHARGRGWRTVAVTNRPSSRLGRGCDIVLDQGCGPELSVLSTKAVTSQFLSLAVAASPLLTPTEEVAVVDRVRALQATEGRRRFASIGAEMASSRYVFVLGRDWLLPIAREFALKIQEGLSIPAQGVTPAALKHGPLALVGDSCMVIALSSGTDSDAAQLEVTLSQVVTRGGRVWSLGAPSSVGDSLRLDPIGGGSYCELDAGQFLVAQQLVVWLAGSRLDLDVDRPRNLAKTMTVP